MRKKDNILFLMACLSAFACSKIENDNQPARPIGEEFVAGEEVTLLASAGEKDKSKVSSEDADGKINFKWEVGDQIRVTVPVEGGEPQFSVFTLTDGAGTTRGRFVGTMPAAGNTFDVQYPVDDPDLSKQTYSKNEALPHGKMKFEGAGALDKKRTSILDLTPAYSALQMNLYGPGLKIDSVKITITDGQKCTLKCEEEGIALPASGNVPFYIVVLPTGKDSVNFTANVFAKRLEDKLNIREYSTYGKGTLIIPGGDRPSINCTMNNTSFKKSKVKNTPELRLGTVWAPVNCGYDATDFTYGKYYQFGRAVGFGMPNLDGKTFKDTWTPSSTDPVTNPSDTRFYTRSSEPNDWYTTKTDNQLKKWPMTIDDQWDGKDQDGKKIKHGYNQKKLDNPCPDGWRVPTQAELTGLFGNNIISERVYANHGSTDVWGCYYNGTGSNEETTYRVFLPLTSWIQRSGNIYDEESDYVRGYSGIYWSSNANSTNGRAWALRIVVNKGTNIASDVEVRNSIYRVFGLPVRCVQN